MGTTNSKTADGLDIKCVSLASGLLPSWGFKLNYDKQIVHGKAKELLKTYVPKRTRSPVSAVLPSVAALGSEEDIYTLGNCGLFSAVLTRCKYLTG